MTPKIHIFLYDRGYNVLGPQWIIRGDEVWGSFWDLGLNLCNLERIYKTTYSVIIMIEYLRGTCVQRTPTSAVIDVHGVGYEIFITINTYNLIEEGAGGECKLFVHEVIREDTHDLYGFAQEIERRLFRMLITVNSVGASTAQVMLSTFTPEDLARKIANGDEESLKAIKGIGVKTAQRIIVDLKKKVAKELAEHLNATPEDSSVDVPSTDKEVIEEGVKAFVALGYPAAAARKVALKIAKGHPGVSINDMIRMGLRMF